MKKLRHEQIANLVHAFAPNMTDDGVCNGFSSILAQAVITGKKEKKEFFDRLDLISRYFKDPRNNPMTLKQEVDTLLKAHTPAPITNEVPPFTEDELLKIQVRAFAEAVAIQQDPSSLYNFESIYQKDKDKLYPLTVSKALEKRFEETESVKIQTDIVGVLGLDLSGLVDYLKKMKTELKKQKSPEDFSFILNSDEHSIHLNFDSETTKWHLTDINHLSDKKNYYFEENSNQLARKIFKSLLDNKYAYTVFSIECMSLGKKPGAIQSFINISNQLIPDSINRVNSRRYTTLHAAAVCGQLEVVKLLLENKAAINIADFDGNTPLSIAATDGHLEIVKLLLENGSDINVQNINGNTPLHLAASRGQLEVAEFLFKNGADINVQNKNGNTPLEIEDSYGNDLLDLAVLNDQVELIKLILENGTYINAHNKYGNSPLHLAASQGKLEVVKFLVKNGADIQAQNKYGIPPLHLAASKGQLEVVEFLFKNGADINTPNRYGYTPLHSAAHQGQLDVVEFLIENRADITLKNQNGDTPLHLAAQFGHLEVVKILLDNGADINALNKRGESPLHSAASYSRLEVVKFLTEKKDTLSTPMAKAAIFSSMETTDPLNPHKRDTPEDDEKNVSSEKKIKKQRK